MATKAAKASFVRLLVPAGKAAPTPPVGPALGARGVKSMDFCKEFNARTSHIEVGVPIPTQINVNADRTFSFQIKSPPTAFFLKRIVGIEKGNGKHDQTIGTISLKHIYEIAKIKAMDEHMSNIPLESIAKTVIATAKNNAVAVIP
ncbi:mitochondrial 54S ribosomal protein YmL19 [Calocera viscosa TUFC12733]|uniref:Large ribosomal subunit protein uL11m n=1 Tax=Calocera viscosa (strain TUFC12733) TaxID=1330018 RepID=A0A167J5G9_CALVF|nr:mitochondrial 54S ribosomal protein YmL19 [Calocera viscosa TUFC12733]